MTRCIERSSRNVATPVMPSIYPVHGTSFLIMPCMSLHGPDFPVPLLEMSPCLAGPTRDPRQQKRRSSSTPVAQRSLVVAPRSGLAKGTVARPLAPPFALLHLRRTWPREAPLLQGLGAEQSGGFLGASLGRNWGPRQLLQLRCEGVALAAFPISHAGEEDDGITSQVKGFGLKGS